MKSKIIALVATLSCILLVILSNKYYEIIYNSESEAISELNSYDYLLNDIQLKELLESCISPNKTIRICSPIYVTQFNVDKQSISQYELMPFKTAIFPVLEDKKISGFIMYIYNEDEICGTPMFMPISNSAYNKLKKRHTLKIAMARWKVGGDHRLTYLYFSDDNEAGFIWDLGITEAPPQIQFEYETLTELQGFNLKSLEVIKTFTNNSEE